MARIGLLDARGDLGKADIAFHVAISVVDLLEVVQIHVTERKGPLRLHRFLQFTEQDTAVGKPRQGIVLRHQLQPLLLMGKIHGQTHHA